MKYKRITCILLSVVISALCITGCTEFQDTEYQTADAPDDAAEDEITYDNGIPWLNSCLQGNVTEDTPIDPKEDFFLYVAKDWLVDTKIPDGHQSYSWYSQVYKNNTDLMIDLLNKNEPKDHDAELVQDLYNKYLDMDARDEVGVKPLEEVANVIQNINSFDELNKLISDSEYANFLYKLVDIYVDTGVDDPSLYIPIIDSPWILLGDSAEYDEMTEYGETIYNYRKEEFVYIAGRLGIESTDAEEIFDNAIEYERTFAGYIFTSEDQMASDYIDKINNLLSCDEILSLTENFPMEDVLMSRGLKYDGEYLNINKEYMEHLDEFYNSDNLKKITDTMLVHYLVGNLNDLDEEAGEKRQELQKNYYGVEGESPREEDAYNTVCAMLPNPATKVFVDNFSSEEDRQVVEDTCYKVINTYKEMLAENDWLSDETRQNAIEKLGAITVNVGWPKVWDDYGDVDISELSYIESLSAISVHDLLHTDSLLGTRRSKDQWASGRSLIDCNAYYSLQDNSINMNVGMMGAPFYYSGMPEEELYASLGAFWIGHEISHGFDSNGSQFDKDGSFVNWWADEDLEEFQRRVKKADDYLDAILIMGDYHVNGSNVDTEMIADYTGLQCAVKMSKEVEDFDYKKFFEYYVYMNVSKELYQEQISMITMDTHPLDYLRGNIPVQQFDEFIDAYDIKPGDNMYLAPEDRILIW